MVEAMKAGWRRILELFSHWKEINPHDLRFGKELLVLSDPSLDPGTPRKEWSNWVVLKNDNAAMVYIVRKVAITKRTECNDIQIYPGQRFAVQVGPGDLEYMFWAEYRPKNQFAAPILLDRFPDKTLLEKDPTILRL